MRRSTRIALEAGISAVLAFVISLIVFGPLLSQLDVGWGGGDMLSTYVNATDWGGLGYAPTTHFGFPLGMVLNYYPGIDVTQNAFAFIANAITGGTFLGINLLVVVSFPLVAALAYLVIRMTGLQGPLAIALAVAFTFIPFHWGRALGHTYLATLYSAVIGMALVLAIGSGTFERLARTGPTRRRVFFWIVVAVMVITVAWSGVYYAAFTLILGGAALVWRIARRAPWRSIAIEVIPFASIVIVAVIGFLPSVLTVRGDRPLASLGERLPYESVIFAGNLAMALLPLPQSSLPGMGFYNNSVVEAIQAAPFGESTAITNHGTWITSLALVIFLVGLLIRSRRSVAAASQPEPVAPAKPDTDTRVSLGLITYLIIVVLLFFIPWGLNYLVAGTLTAQIRGWNRLVPLLLLLFILGAAAVLHRTPVARKLALSIPIALVVLALTAVDSVLPFRAAYAGSVHIARELSDAATEYTASVNTAIPQDCGVLQLPYMPYAEFGVLGGINDYDHFWMSITNEGKSWSYGAVKYTDASVWAAQLPEVPTDEQASLLVGAGFCAIHLDTRGYISEELAPLLDAMKARFGEPVADGFDGKWLLFSLDGIPAASPEAVTAFLHQPMVFEDPVTVAPRQTDLERSWYWTAEPTGTFTIKPTGPDGPIHSVSGGIASAPCGPLPVNVTLTSEGGSATTTVLAKPGEPAPFDLALPAATDQPVTLTVDAPGEGCPLEGPGRKQFAQVVNLQAR